MSIDINRTHQ